MPFQNRKLEYYTCTEKSELYSMVNEIHQTLDEWSHDYLVLNGKVVSAIQQSDDETKSKMSDILSKCKSVIACRLSPIQKSDLVIMMKNASVSNITCAIGDGGNDVSMIQQAHVGLGNVLHVISSTCFLMFCYVHHTLAFSPC